MNEETWNELFGVGGSGVGADADADDDLYFQAGVSGPGAEWTSSGPHGETSLQAQQRAAQSAAADDAIPEDPETQAGDQGSVPMAQLIGPDIQAASDSAFAQAQAAASRGGGSKAPIPVPDSPLGASPTVTAKASMTTGKKLLLLGGAALGGYRLLRGRWPW